MHAKRCNMCSVFLACCFLYSAGSLSAAENTPRKNYTEPASILADVSNRGACVVASGLYSDSEKWNFVLRNIATGTGLWLKVAVALHSGSDAAISEMLSLAVGEALEKAPENVFRIALPEFQLKLICGGPDVDDSRYDSYERAMEAIKRRQKKVSALADPDVRRLSEQCVQVLEESKEGMAKFYGINKKNRGVRD